MKARCDALEAENALLRLALIRLSNEVLGIMPLMEPLVRREFGNSNYTILVQRAEEARELIVQAEKKDAERNAHVAEPFRQIVNAFSSNVR